MRHRRPNEFETFSPLPGRGLPPFGAGDSPPQHSWGTICGGIVVGAVVLGGIAAGIVYALPEVRRSPEAIRESVVTALLCDVSDRLTPGMQDQVRRIFDEEMPAGFRRGDVAIVGQLSDKVQSPLQLHLKGVRDTGHPDECRNPLVCTSGVEARRRAEQFLGPFWQAARRCLEPGNRPVSPVVEGISTLSRQQAFASVPTTTRRRLVVLSDLLQHAPHAASLYEREPSKSRGGKATPGEFTLYTPAGKAYVAKHIGALQNTEVVVLFIRRPEEAARQDYRVREWFERYLTDSGAQLPIQFREIW